MSISIEKKSMSQNKIFFDTNVLVYAHDESASYHAASALLLKMALENQIQGVIAEQNIIELYRILTLPAAMKGTPLTPGQTQDLIRGTYLSGASGSYLSRQFNPRQNLTVSCQWQCQIS